MVKLVRLDLGGNLLQVANQWHQHQNHQCRFDRYYSNMCGSFHGRYHPHYIKNNNHTWRQNQELEGSSLSSLPMLATLYLDGNRVRTMMWWWSSGSVDGCDHNHDVARDLCNKILEPQNGNQKLEIFIFQVQFSGSMKLSNQFDVSAASCPAAAKKMTLIFASPSSPGFLEPL